MSLKIIKAGILDTVQDMGRYGHQHLGINPGGVMDRFTACIANILVGNNKEAAVIELHFPASVFLFEKESIIAVAGADFTPVINGEKIPLLHPVVVNKNSVLQFQKAESATRCYLAVSGGLDINKWLNSYSTNLKAAAGGYNGRALQKDDVINLKKEFSFLPAGHEKDFMVLPWKANDNCRPAGLARQSHAKAGQAGSPEPGERIAVISGHEWDVLTDETKNLFLNQAFVITFASDRMGYRLYGPALPAVKYDELVSSPVSFGTIQLLPDGQLIILMADHQTTGGYPKIAHVISSHLSQLAQMRPGEKIRFELTDQQTAENLFLQQHRHLQQLENACKFKLEEFFKE